MNKEVIIATIQGEEHLGDNLKKQCIDYINNLETNWNELKKWLEDEIIVCKAVINTILPEFEKIMPRSSGKTLLTNEYNKQQTIIKTFEVMLSKMQELERGEE